MKELSQQAIERIERFNAANELFISGNTDKAKAICMTEFPAICIDLINVICAQEGNTNQAKWKAELRIKQLKEVQDLAYSAQQGANLLRRKQQAAKAREICNLALPSIFIDLIKLMDRLKGGEHE